MGDQCPQRMRHTTIERPSDVNVVTEVDISGQGLCSLPKWLAECYNIDYLICHNNNLTSLENLPSRLGKLDCRSNRLTKLPYPLPPNLKYLECGDNEITQIYDLPVGLEDLYCYRNKITNLQLPSPTNQQCTQQDGVESTNSCALTTLDCSDNRLTQLTLCSLNNLKYFTCCDNSLTHLDDLPDSIETFDCARNKLVSINHLPTSLVQLEANHNELTELGCDCGFPTNLVTCAINNNKLVKVGDFQQSLKSLHCEHNQLTTKPVIPQGSISFMGYGNPFQPYMC